LTISILCKRLRRILDEEAIMATTKKDEAKSEGGSSMNRPRTAAGGEYETRSAQQIREAQQFQVTKAIDQTKEDVRRSIEEAKREIPQYAQSVTDYHQQAMDSAEEIADNYLESQKQIINSTQDTWTNYFETVYWWMSPRKVAEMYSQAVSNLADNAVSASRIWNKTVVGNMDASKAYFVRAREASSDLSRINTNTARTFERTAATAASETRG
jgi:flagellar biosynthesis/type III secretory pathway protein FliH